MTTRFIFFLLFSVLVSQNLRRCSKTLIRRLSIICNHEYRKGDIEDGNIVKTEDHSTIESHTHEPSETETKTENNDDSLVGKCCRKLCSYETLKSYCKND
uniref:Insulin-like domain-containing protein n=1 Tax=viral metagenome TaxID=1070528 RepID=A0A6C0JPF1_9ZZZZ